MPTIRPIPTLAAAALVVACGLSALAQAPAPAEPAPPQQPGATPGFAAPAGVSPPAPPPPPTEAERKVDDAIKKLAATPTVSADLRQTVDMLGKKFEVKGRYLKDAGYRIYLKLSVSGLGNSTGTMLQVCDGTTLWDYQQILESQRYSKITIGPVMAKISGPGVDAAIRDQVVTRLGFSGPDALLAGLRKTVHFDNQESATLDGKPVWIVAGDWIDRNGLVGPNGQPLPASPTPLPAYVPSRVLVTIGQDDGWPYVVKFIGKTPTILSNAPRLGPDGKPIRVPPSPRVDPSKVELTYTNVQINVPIPPESFAFQAPPDAQVADGTNDLVSQLDQVIQFQAEKARQDAAKAAAPTTTTLEKGIDAPAPPAESAIPPVAAPR